MKEKLKDRRLLATLSIVFFILLCLAIIDWEEWYLIDTGIFHIICAILFGISYIGFLIFGTKENGTKILFTITIFGVVLGLLSFYLMSTCYIYYLGSRSISGHGYMRKDFGILFTIIALISIITLLLKKIRNQENDNNKPKKNKKDNNKEKPYDKKTLLIVGGFIIILFPIIYYFLFQLPKHNRELEQIELKKLEYQKQQDQQKEATEILKKNQYNDCIEDALFNYNNVQHYCDMGYQDCLYKVDEYNRNYGAIYGKKNSDIECAKYKGDGYTCFLLDRQQEVRENDYKKALEECERLYNK